MKYCGFTVFLSLLLFSFTATTRLNADEDRTNAPGDALPGSYDFEFRKLYSQLGRIYPGFQLKNIDWPAVGKELLPRAQKVRSAEEFGLLCMELLARLKDSHAHLVWGVAPIPSPPLPLWDPGFACLIDDRNQPVVYYVDRGGPAQAAGIRIGMTVVSVNGKPAASAIKQWMATQTRYVGYSSEQYLRYHAARFFLRQKQQGAKVSVKMQVLNGQTRSVID